MEITKLIKQNDDLQDNINSLMNQVLDMKRKIKNNERYIYLNCDHEWIYDRLCAPYDKNKYYCKHCMLWRSSDIYL